MNALISCLNLLGEYIPIEIKYNSTVKKNQLITIKSFIKEFNCPFSIGQLKLSIVK